MTSFLRLLSAFVVASLLSACAFTTNPAPRPKALGNLPQGRIAKRVLLLIPAEFEQFTYVASFEGREIRYPFGASTSTTLPSILRSAFTNVSVETISGDSGFLLALSSARSKQFDYVARPKFVNTNAFVRPFTLGVETGILVEFTKTDRTRSFAAMGKGEGKAHAYFQGPLEAAGREALEGTLRNLHADILARKAQF